MNGIRSDKRLFNILLILSRAYITRRAGKGSGKYCRTMENRGLRRESVTRKRRHNEEKERLMHCRTNAVYSLSMKINFSA